jgi:hypothetical protein
MDQNSFFVGYAFGVGVMAMCTIPRIILDAWHIYRLQHHSASAGPHE